MVFITRIDVFVFSAHVHGFALLRDLQAIKPSGSHFIPNCHQSNR